MTADLPSRHRRAQRFLRQFGAAATLAIIATACGGTDNETSNEAPLGAEAPVVEDPSPEPTPMLETAGEPEATSTPLGPTPAATPTTAPTATPTPVPSATPVPVAIPDTLELQLTPLVTISRPIDMATRFGTDDLYVATKGGRVVRLRVDGDTATVEEELIDIGSEISDGAETGLLGLVFSPAGTELYLSYSDRNGDNVVEEFPVIDDALDLDGRRTVLAVEQPARNHNGGDIGFGPDGYLYIALGDGGGAGDPFATGQDPDSLLGSILRIDPTGDPYAIPADNPFAEGGGRPEIFAIGARNPWRISFDRATGDLWIADVGQGALEEVDVLYASEGGGLGANLGWSLVEGSLPFKASGPPSDAYVEPVYEYGREDGCSITGGYVYRGSAIPALQGSYVFGDYCSGRTWGLASSQQQGVVGRFDLGLTVGRRGLVSFGEDHEGELYVLSFDDSISRIDPR